MPARFKSLLVPDTQNNHRFAVGPLHDVGAVNKNVVERFVVLGGGNVGIGTSTPKLKLEIQGEKFLAEMMGRRRCICLALRSAIPAVPRSS